MKISIITPTYNAESVVEHAILSAKNQQYEDYEHIIMDACSNRRKPRDSLKIRSP